MRLFLSILIFLSISFLFVNADTNMVTEDRLISIVEKQDIRFEHFKETTQLTLKHELDLTKISLDKTNAYIEHTSDRIDNISASVDRFAMLTTFFGVLITIIVFFFSFKSNSEARQTVEEWLEENGDDFVNKEMQPIKDDFNKMIINMQKEMEIFKQKSDEEIESLKEQLEEKGNEVIENLSSNILEDDIVYTELSLVDKQLFEHQIRAIKSKPIKKRIFSDYKKIILFNIANKNYNDSVELINKLLKNNFYNHIEKGMLFHLKGLSQYKNTLLAEAILSFDSAIEIAPTLVLPYIDKAKIFNLQGNYKEAKVLLNKVLDLDNNNYQAYKRLAYSTRIQAFAENKPLLYLKAIKYLEHAIAINPDKADAYNDIGVIYIVQYEYMKAEKWLKKSLKMNPNEWAYVNLYLTYLFLNKSYPIELEKEYFLIFGKNDTEQFSLYNLFKIIKSVSNNKYLNQKSIQEELEIWYKKIPKHRHYYFNPLKNWIDNQNNNVVKNNLKYLIELIELNVKSR